MSQPESGSARKNASLPQLPLRVPGFSLNTVPLFFQVVAGRVAQFKQYSCNVVFVLPGVREVLRALGERSYLLIFRIVWVEVKHDLMKQGVPLHR